MKKIKLVLKERSYDILIGSALIKNCGALLKRLGIGRDAVIVTNRHLLQLYRKPLEKSLKANGFSTHFELVPDSERAKSATVAANLIDRIARYDRRKEIFIIAFGGGVIGDLAGFVASVYKRGVPYVQIPTTLLAQVDSAIGGKVAIDLPIAKNLVGAFYQPRMVISDVSLLKTLPLREVRNGLAEIIKYGVIKDKKLFEFLETNYKRILELDRKMLEYVVLRSSKIKADVVRRDEFDKKGIRAILNYGHTMGHAIEAASRYSKRYNHGEAVAIGMVIASEISSILGMIGSHESERIESLIKKAGLPTTIKGLKILSVYESHLHDKKFVRRKNRFVLPIKIGKVRIAGDVPDYIIKSVLKKYFQND